MSEKEQKSYKYLRGHTAPASQIIAVGGGKGGIGKSFVSSSLAILLGQLGYKTTLIDLDLGSANLHTTMGLGLPKTGISDYLKNPNFSLAEVATPTSFVNLKLISGGNDSFSVPDLAPTNSSRLMSDIYKLQSDFVVLDLSAGNHSLTLDLFLTAIYKVIVMTPEPSSIENAYNFIKAAFYRRLKRYEYQLELTSTIDEIMSDREQFAVKSPSDLLKAIDRKDSAVGTELRSLMNQFNLNILLNQSRSISDNDLGPSIQNVCNRFFGIDTEYLGHIDHDNAVWQALRRRKHLISEYPQSRAYTQILKIARRMAISSKPSTMVS